MLSETHPPFDRDGFITDCLDGYEELELTSRARKISQMMEKYLPENFEQAAEILVASLGPRISSDELVGQGLDLFVYLPHVFYVAARGLNDWETSMWVQHQLTQRFSCEYSIRFFLERDAERTLGRLRQWTSDPSPHVRRLVSEGTRPRLPWAPRLRDFQKDPAPVLELLELLKDDPASLVRRSVANNLNDIGKDHPRLLVETCRRWMVDASVDRRALIRHALRTAVKRGEPGALETLGYTSHHQVRIHGVSWRPEQAVIGSAVEINFTVTNDGDEPGEFNVDLKVHFVKANGSTTPKVFKVKQLTLAPGETAALRKRVSLAQHTTRTHYPGLHAAEVLVNGVTSPGGSFAARATT